MELLYADKRIAVAVKPPGILSTDEPGGMPELLRRDLTSERNDLNVEGGEKQ